MRKEAVTALAVVVSLGCSSLERRVDRAPVVLREAGVTVHADARLRGSEYRVSAVGARSAHGNLREFTVCVFADKNGDGKFDEDEQRASWHASTGTPSSSMSASGHVSWTPAPDSEDAGELLIYAEVELEGGARYHAVHAFPTGR